MLILSSDYVAVKATEVSHLFGSRIIAWSPFLDDTITEMFKGEDPCMYGAIYDYGAAAATITHAGDVYTLVHFADIAAFLPKES